MTPGLTQTAWQTWSAGGWIMIPLFALALLSFVTSFQLLAVLRRGRLETAGSERWADWIRRPDEAPGRVGDILRYLKGAGADPRALRQRCSEVSLAFTGMLERRIIFLKALVAAAPLLGLLGTVMGMLKTFSGLSGQAVGPTGAAVASGISEALITTQTGLLIALPGLLLLLSIERQKHAFEGALARMESLMLTRAVYHGEGGT